MKCECFSKPQVCIICNKKAELWAPRAGTPGFRAPEVLLKYLDQTCAIDIWSAGVILASLLSGRYPFFRNTDDMMALAEIASLLGTKKICREGKRLGRIITLASPNREKAPLDLKVVCEKLRPQGTERDFPNQAYDLLGRLLDPNHWTRISAADALEHPFIVSCFEKKDSGSQVESAKAEEKLLPSIVGPLDLAGQIRSRFRTFTEHVELKA